MANLADTTILSWITAEVDQALEMVRRNIAKFLTVREDPALLAVCPEHLHQVSGALRMVGLSGATRFCEAIEKTIPGADGPAPSAAAMEVIDRSVLALKEFVNDLARGQANVPLRLLPAYLDLARLNGGEDACEKDLFFPDLSPQPPAHEAAHRPVEAELAVQLQAQRARFQRGLLAWLREQPAGLDEMRQALDALHQMAAQLPEPHGLWWASQALVDGLRQPPDAEWLKCAKAVCNRIDFHIRDLAAGSKEAGEPLLREVLYVIGKLPPFTQHIKDVKQLYQLDGLFPAPGGPAAGGEVDIQFLEVALYDLHSRLDSLKSAWVRYVSGERKSAAQFRDLVGAFRAKAVELGNAHLVKLLDAIALVATRLPDPCPRHNQFMVIEMAAAFLLVEHVVDHFTAPSEDLDRQIVLMGGWLLDAEKGRSTGEPPAGLRPELTQQIGALQLRAQVAKEILANLQHIEQVLDAFAREPAKRDTLPALDAHLRQIHGALAVLGFERAAQALKLCERMISACAEPDHALAARDMDWIAEGLSCLGFFLTPCLHGREPAEQALELFHARFQEASDKPETAPADITVRLQPGSPAEQAPPAEAAKRGDPALLGVFLEEAAEVLENIEGCVPACEKDADQGEALTTIRRGFHTLKGSGRMVGLMDLGEAAWEVEQTLNLWLDEKRAATAKLMELVRVASASFRGWVEDLRGGSLSGEVDAAHIAERARQLRESGKEAPPGPEEVTIGSVTLPRPFFEVYAKEAGQHAAALKAEFADWAPETEPSGEFMRAAHTLASSSRTAGFGAIADLAATVEQWIPFASQTSAAHAAVLRTAIETLSVMAAGLARCEDVGTGGEATLGMRDLVAKLRQPPVAPVQAPATAEPPAASAEAPAAPAEKRVMRDDIDPQLLPIFLEEAQELVPAIGSDLRDWKANPTDAQVSQSLQRSLHTLKGSARMAGAIRLGELTHIMESRIEAAFAAGEFPAALFEELEAKMDRLSLDVERMRGGGAAAEPAAGAAAGEAPAQAAAMLRVNADTLDQLINEAGEVAIARSRLEAELRAVKQSLSDLSESVARLRNQLREVEVQADSQMQSRLSVVEEKSRDYDPLEFDRYTRLQELTRLMAEGLNDVGAIQQALARNAGETEAALLQQARITRGVQQELMHMRAVPFANLNERLYRVVRQVARELEKKAGLEIEGAEVELDRSVLERIAAPVEHILRNAVAHGLESPAARAAAGKPETGLVSVMLRQESNEIALIIADDGGGLDLDALRSKGIELGLVDPAAPLADADLAQLIFASGLSTADEITEIAGRGIGMDVVRSEIAAIGGRVEIATRRGHGTTFTLYLPLTLAVTQAVLVRAGGSVLAIAAGMVEQVLRIKGDAMGALYEKGEVQAQQHVYPLHYLQRLLGMGTPLQLQAYNSVLLVRSGIQRLAVHADELIGNQEIVVKYIGPQLSRIPGVSGATVLADGAIALIINPVQLEHGAQGTAHASVDADAFGVTAAPAVPLVMVVDDSLTVRKVTGRLLEREGYRVATAKDGVDALEMLKEALPAAMLVDIEMPRMDGFQLTRQVRADPRTAAIPIIVISSRTAEKHRTQAAQLGVNAFLGKPYQEADLLRELEKHLPE